MIQHRLILFYGSSSGAGKSTLSSMLTQQLTQHCQPVEWLYEDDVAYLSIFEPVMQQIHGESSQDLLDACLTATAKLVEAYIHTEKIVITDSILPYYDWLFAANYSYPLVETFSQKLRELLYPLQPLIIYLRADVATVLQRAVDQRGQAWLHELIAFMNSWSANQHQPINNFADVVAYLQRTDNWKTQLLAQWSGAVLWLDSTTYPLEMCASILLDELGLLSKEAQPEASAGLLNQYVGHYRTENPDPPDNQPELTIMQRADELWATLYWPNGCLLVAEGEHRFRLQNTSHTILFVDPEGKRANQLHYLYCGKTYIYMRVPADD